jgi:hypothetical protein
MTPPHPQRSSAEDLALNLRPRLRGTLALSDQPDYELAQPWNQAVAVTPAAVIAAADADDIVQTFQFAAGRFQVAIQSTGHGATPVGEETLLLHTGRLQQVCIDPASRIAHIGAGVTAQQLLDAAAPHGLAAPVGSAPTVGVVGYLSGGGISPFVATFGLSADYIRAMDVVTGDGIQRRVTAEEHPDLYWGFRGGRSTLGCITAADLELLPIDSFYGGALYFAADDVSNVLHTWSEWSAQLSDGVTTSVALLRMPDLPPIPRPLAGKLTVAVRFASTLPSDLAEQELAPIRAAGTPVIDDIATRPYSEMGRIYNEPPHPVSQHHDQTLLPGLSRQAIESLVDLAGPTADSPLMIVELRRFGDALAKSPIHPSAFSYRAEPYSLSVIGSLTPITQGTVPAAAEAILAALRPQTEQTGLINFIHKGPSSQLKAAYDPATLSRLRSLANQYDPQRVMATFGLLD